MSRTLPARRTTVAVRSYRDSMFRGGDGLSMRSLCSNCGHAIGDEWMVTEFWYMRCDHLYHHWAIITQIVGYTTQRDTTMRRLRRTSHNVPSPPARWAAITWGMVIAPRRSRCGRRYAPVLAYALYKSHIRRRSAPRANDRHRQAAASCCTALPWLLRLSPVACMMGAR